VQLGWLRLTQGRRHVDVLEQPGIDYDCSGGGRIGSNHE
jgi:hypothetical protein